MLLIIIGLCLRYNSEFKDIPSVLLARSMAMDKEEGRNAEGLGSLSQSLGLRYTHRLAHTCTSESHDKRTITHARIHANRV